MENNDYTSSSMTTGASDATGTSGSSNTTGNMGSDAQGMTDRARDLAGTAQDKLADVGSTVRDRAGHLKDSLADALQTGAEKLRSRGGELAGATSSGSMAMDGNGRATQVAGRVAGGMDATADWLRDADLDGLRTSIEAQVKEHPGRTLMIAVGLGYLLGKAVRK
jgi:hypothetical protein